MTKSEQRRLNAKIKEWDKTSGEANSSIAKFFKVGKKQIKDFINSMMYTKKPTDKIDRFWHELSWWFKIVVIFFALKGLTYWLNGR